MNCRHFICHSCPDETLQLRAEVERLREIVAVNDQRLATMHDEKQ